MVLGNSFVERRTGFIHKGVVSAWLGDVALGGKVDGKQHKPTGVNTKHKDTSYRVNTKQATE